MKPNLSKMISRLIMLMAAAVLLAFNLSLVKAQVIAGSGPLPGSFDNSSAPAKQSAATNATPTLNSPVSSCTTSGGAITCQIFESDAAGNPSEISNVITLPAFVVVGFVVLLESPNSDPNDQSQWSDVLVFGAGTGGGINNQARLFSDGCASGNEGDRSCFPSVATVNASNHVYIVQTQVGTGNDDTDVTLYVAGTNQYFVHSDAELTFIVNYFAGANGARPDQTVRVTNPGSAVTAGATADLCANIYVFRNDQQLAECCSCLVTPNGLRTLSVDFDLARNPLTSATFGEGVIKIVSSPVNTSGAPCPVSKAGTTYPVSWVLKAWAVHNQDVSGGLQGTAINQVTETHFLNANLSQAELSDLQSNCAFIFAQGSGAGVCRCGRGD